MKIPEFSPLSIVPTEVGHFKFGTGKSPRMLLALGNEGRPGSVRQIDVPAAAPTDAITKVVLQIRDADVMRACELANYTQVVNPEHMIARMKRMIDPKTMHDLWFLDGEPLIEIWPMKTSSVKLENGGTYIRIVLEVYVYPRTGGAN